MSLEGHEPRRFEAASSGSVGRTERATERERESERETDRHTHRQTDRQTEMETEKETEQRSRRAPRVLRLATPTPPGRQTAFNAFFFFITLKHRVERYKSLGALKDPIIFRGSTKG